MQPCGTKHSGCELSDLRVRSNRQSRDHNPNAISACELSDLRVRSNRQSRDHNPNANTI